MDAPSLRSLGDRGEDLAAAYLRNQGLELIDRHYRQKWGEIDLVCRDQKTVVFVEVKWRASNHLPSAIDAITYRKCQRLLRAAYSYMKWKHLEDCPLRFDLVLIEAGKIQWIPDAFGAPSYYTY